MDVFPTTKLKERLGATHLEIVDETDRHRGHREGGSGHYQLTIVSPLFRNQTKVSQHRSVYQALAEEMGTTIHALSIRSFTPEEWEKI